MTNAPRLWFLQLVLLAAGLCAAAAPAAARQPQRGIGVRTKDAGGQTREIVLYEGSYALLIGNARYADGWDALPGVASDLPAVRAVLERHGFKVEVAENLNSRQFDERMRQFIDDYGYQRNNRLLIYFAGHGHTLTSAGDGRELGYVVPTDAPSPHRDELGFRRKAVSMDAIQTYARQIQAKHALFLFDSCFSGKLVSRSAVPVTPYIEESVAYAVRQFITSGAANQPVPDESIFRRALVRGLEGEADRNGDRYVTGTELAEYLKEKVTNYTERQQTPQYGKINDIYLDRGDFVFVLPTATPAADAASATRPSPPSSSAVFLASYARWLELLDASGSTTVVREADEELARNPGNALALRARSAAHYMIIDIEKGRSDAEGAARLLSSPASAAEYEARCYAHWRLEKADEAIADCTRAIDLDPRYKWAYRDRGSALRDKQEYDRALADYNRAIDLDPKSAIAYNGRCYVYNDKREYDRAIADCARAIDLNPKFAWAYANRGDSYLLKKDYDRALADFTRAIELEPKLPPGYNGRGEVYRDHRRDYDRALAEFTRAIELAPKYVWAYVNRGYVYHLKRDLDRAAADFTTAIGLAPKDAGIYMNRGNTYYEKQDYDRAIADFTRAVELEPKLHQVYNNRGNSYYNKGEYDRSLADYTRAIEIDPKNVLAYRNRGLTYHHKREYDRAIADLDTAIRLDPNYALAYRSRARSLEAKGDTARAEADRAKAAELEKTQTQPKP